MHSSYGPCLGVCTHSGFSCLSRWQGRQTSFIFWHHKILKVNGVISQGDILRSDRAIDCTYGLFSPLWVILDGFQVLDRFQKTYPPYFAGKLWTHTLLPTAPVMQIAQSWLEDILLPLKFCVSHNQISLLPVKLEVLLGLFKQEEWMVCWPASSWKGFALCRTWLLCGFHVAFFQDSELSLLLAVLSLDPMGWQVTVGVMLSQNVLPGRDKGKNGIQSVHSEM